MKKREMFHSKLDRIEEWCLYCFMIFCYSKVNDIKVPAVLASQIHRFIISLSQIMLFHMNICFEREKNEKKRNKNGFWKNWYDRFVRQMFDNVKQTQVSVNGQQAQIECSRLWREIKKGKDNAARKSEAQKLMLQ